MLYPVNTESRTCINLDGLWKFLIEEDIDVDVSKPLKTSETIVVPGSYNDQLMTNEARNHVGNVWYEKEFVVPTILLEQRIVLRFGSVTHQAKVYINGKKVMAHKGGFVPFEVELSEIIVPGKNRLTVRVNNVLNYSTLPVGIYSEEIDELSGKLKKTNIPNFDFFNYAGIHRPVKLYTTPETYIEDMTVSYQLENGNAHVSVAIKTEATFDRVKVTIFDEEGQWMTEAEGERANVLIPQAKLWEPLNAYLYTIRVEGLVADQLVDVYEDTLGIRTVKVEKGQFLINDKPFYFKGFGKHEDTYLNGRGLNEVANKADLSLFKWIGANSFRTSHYPYSEEMMRLAEREGIVVIDEVPAVGLYVGFSVSLVPRQSLDNTWEELDTYKAHEKAIKDLIKRDKNYACVVMWSIANEAATHQTGADTYFKPLIELARQEDPQSRPITIVFIQESSPEADKVSDFIDVISLNRYYGWYIELNNLDKAKHMLSSELDCWLERHPNKPILFTEYGADTIPGFHSIVDRGFTEEYQVKYYKANHEVFDEHQSVIGEQVWNFADFDTRDTTKRVHGNKKGIFTRAREPKLIAHVLRERWSNIPDFNYKTNK